uniref:Zinc finger PHD-type domain-containing protein n=1 Tax=Daphnia galeata TaxID=27404 RepID=A0A8J2RTW7_9CRUS|nr:unnamed protein product [Daphnia galeata]
MLHQVPEQVSSAVQNPEIKFDNFRKLFDEDAGILVLQMVETKKHINNHICYCNKPVNEDGGILCNSCLLLCHRKCEKLTPGEVIKIVYDSSKCENCSGKLDLMLFKESIDKIRY